MSEKQKKSEIKRWEKERKGRVNVQCCAIFEDIERMGGKKEGD